MAATREDTYSWVRSRTDGALAGNQRTGPCQREQGYKCEELHCVDDQQNEREGQADHIAHADEIPGGVVQEGPVVDAERRGDDAP